MNLEITKVTLGKQRRKKRKESEKLKKRLKEAINACWLLVIRVMGSVKRSENSLNQHIKLKHPELWSKFKNPEMNASELESGDKINGHEEKKELF